MIFQFKMEKILNLKQKEKEMVEAQYGEYVNVFEELARSLYELLKQKETIEEHAAQQFRSKMIINELQQTQRFLLSLSHRILDAQHKVQQARERMNICHQELLVKTMETKKYEKLKEKQREEHERFLTAAENRQNDEFSILRYISQ